MANAKIDVNALREKVMKSDDIKHEMVYVKEWDVELPVKTLSSKDLKEVMKYRKDEIRMSILAVIHGCKTEDGESVFTETDLAKFEDEKAFGAIQQVAGRVLELSGFGEDSVEEAKNA